MSCRFSCSDLYEMHECVNWDYMLLEYYFGYGLLARFVTPEWEYADYSA